MKFFESSLRIQVVKLLGIDPFGKLLEGDKVVGGIIELVPDSMELTTLHRLKRVPTRPVSQTL